MKITLEWLREQRACDDQVAIFKQVFGNEAALDMPSAVKAIEARLDLDWLAGHLLGPAAGAEYDRVRAPALAQYDRVTAAAGAEYDRVTAAAGAEYERVTDPARAEYDRVRAPARAEYDRVRAPARAEYERVRAAAGAEYDRVRAAAIISCADQGGTP